MSTLLLRLAAPMQSWGDDSKFDYRRTHREPTKSGVIGLIANALGREREDDISDLRGLFFGTRVDREGVVAVDYQNVHKPYNIDLTKSWKTQQSEANKNAWQTWRYYLEDAVFLVGLESNNTDFLDTIDNAIIRPKRILYFGRKSCPPSVPISLGIRDTTLETALREEPSLIEVSDEIEWYRILRDARPDEYDRSVPMNDNPVTFSPEHRQYTYRPVIEEFVKPVEYTPLESRRCYSCT